MDGNCGTQRELAALRGAILGWHDENARDLPWRGEGDPYRIWVSEIMLQQTRAETVIPYYLRFLSRYPDVQALAAAPLEQVLKDWEGYITAGPATCTGRPGWWRNGPAPHSPLT